MPDQTKSSTPRSILSIFTHLLILVLPGIIVSCSTESADKDYAITIYQTSQSGDRLKLVSSDRQEKTANDGKKIGLQLFPEKKQQEYYGFGASFTESSAWNLATVPVELRKEVLTNLFSPTEGAGFTLTRTHINSSDYSNNHYTYVEAGDKELSTFSIQEDKQGFSGDENEQVRGIELVEPGYDIIPMILEASSIPGADFKIIASPWSPPFLDESRRNF